MPSVSLEMMSRSGRLSVSGVVTVGGGGGDVGGFGGGGGGGEDTWLKLGPLPSPSTPALTTAGGGGGGGGEMRWSWGCVRCEKDGDNGGGGKKLFS